MKMGDGYKAKICGTTNLEDSFLAAAEGADFFGVVVEVDFSPRSLSLEEAKPLFDSPPIPGVALVYRMEPNRVRTVIEKLNPFALQFLGRTDASFLTRLKREYPSVQIWQSVHLPAEGEKVGVDDFKNTVNRYIEAGVDALLFDTAAVSGGKMKFGGTGVRSDWKVVRKLMNDIDSSVPVWLAGGINPENVGEALEAVGPHGIDLCSGVEATPGKKDTERVRALMKTIKEKSMTRRRKN